jgi:hypothetical protein
MSGSADDPHDLSRFVIAQADDYERALNVAYFLYFTQIIPSWNEICAPGNDIDS